MKKIFIQQTFVLKLTGFCFEISSFSSWLFYQFHFVFTADSTWHGSVYFTDAHLEFLEDEFKL